MDERRHYEFHRKLEEALRVEGPPASNVGVVGVVHYRLLDQWGAVKQEGATTNLVTSIGDMHIAQFLAFVAGATVGSVAYAQLGTNTTAPAKGNTDLGTLLATSSRGITATYPQRVTSHSGAGEWTLWRYEWPAGVSTNGSLGEVGQWSSVGSFLAHAILVPNVNKGVNDSLQVDWGWKLLGA